MENFKILPMKLPAKANNAESLTVVFQPASTQNLKPFVFAWSTTPDEPDEHDRTVRVFAENEDQARGLASNKIAGQIGEGLGYYLGDLITWK